MHKSTIKTRQHQYRTVPETDWRLSQSNYQLKPHDKLSRLYYQLRYDEFALLQTISIHLKLEPHDKLAQIYYQLNARITADESCLRSYDYYLEEVIRKNIHLFIAIFMSSSSSQRTNQEHTYPRSFNFSNRHAFSKQAVISLATFI